MAPVGRRYVILQLLFISILLLLKSRDRLDLHPENADKYTVRFLARMETDELCTQQAHLTKRKVTVKILQIVEATRTDNTDLPEIHDHVVKQMQDSFSDEGSGRISVRSLWMSEQTMPMTMSFAQPIYPNIIDMVVNNWPSEIRPLGTQRHESLESM